jgi:hypothetical protein
MEDHFLTPNDYAKRRLDEKISDWQDIRNFMRSIRQIREELGNDTEVRRRLNTMVVDYENKYRCYFRLDQIPSS